MKNEQWLPIIEPNLWLRYVYDIFAVSNQRIKIKKKQYLGSAVMSYIPGVSEKLKKIGNKFGIRIAFISHATLRSIV